MVTHTSYNQHTTTQYLSQSPRCGWFATVSCLVRAAHLVHPRPTVVLVAAEHKPVVPVDADTIVETCSPNQ